MPRSGRPSTAKGRIFQLDRAEDGMPQTFDPIPVGADVIVTPHRFEFGALPRTAHPPIDRPRGGAARAASARNAPTTYRATLSQSMLSAGPGVRNMSRRMLRWPGRERAVVGEHRGGGPVPGDDVPCRGLDKGGATSSVSSTRCKRGVTPSVTVANLGWPAEREQEDVLTFDVGQHHRRRRCDRGRRPRALPRVLARATCTRLR